MQACIACTSLWVELSCTPSETEMYPICTPSEGTQGYSGYNLADVRGTAMVHRWCKQVQQRYSKGTFSVYHGVYSGVLCMCLLVPWVPRPQAA